MHLAQNKPGEGYEKIERAGHFGWALEHHLVANQVKGGFHLISWCNLFIFHLYRSYCLFFHAFLPPLLSLFLRLSIHQHLASWSRHHSSSCFIERNDKKTNQQQQRLNYRPCQTPNRVVVPKTATR